MADTPEKSGSSICVVIPAAGSGTRLGESLPKAFVDVDGQTIIERCVASVPRSLGASVVVVVPADMIDRARLLLPDDVVVVAGGAHRSESVRAGVAAAGDVEVILVHDAARPLTPASVFTRVVDAIRSGHDAVVPGLPVVDTLKSVTPGDTPGLERVAATVDREPLRAVQTPQGFTRDALLAAHADDSGLATDDAGLAERAGIDVHVVAGSPRAMKITTPWDLAIVRHLLSSGGQKP